MRAHHPRVWIGEIDRPCRQVGRRERLAVAAQPATEGVARRRAPVLVGLVGRELDLVVLPKPVRALQQTLVAIARDRPARLLAVTLKLAAALAQPLPPAALARHRPLRIDLGHAGRLILNQGATLALGEATLRLGQRGPATLGRAQLLGQLIAAILAVELVLTPVGLFGFTENLLDQPAVGAVLIHRRVRLDLRPVDRDHSDRHQPRLPTQAQNVVEQLRDLSLVTTAELRDRRVIRRAQTRDHLERHVLPTRPLDPPRRPVPARVRIEQQGNHHLRVTRRATRTAEPIRLPEPIQVHHLHSAEHRPHQVVLGQPLRQRRRHQQHLTTVTRNEI